MKNESTDPCVILCLAGLDPTGGAGLQADIETVAALGGHALPVATALTAQDTNDVKALIPIPAEDVLAQVRPLLADIAIDGIKIGLLGGLETIGIVHDILVEHRGIPVVLDPVCRAGGGKDLVDDALTEALVEDLLPHTTVLTPNRLELHRLAPNHPHEREGAKALLQRGCKSILITGADEDTPQVINRFHTGDKEPLSFGWERIEGVFHGSGCTLATAVATYLAMGQTPLQAVECAQGFAHEAIARGYRIGSGQSIPNRRGLGKIRPRNRAFPRSLPPSIESEP
ncbi:bifunctional hydroxymethylpyrimidine kinase/phosphomethylpyrimidine kinase [Thioalkalivibrio sp. HK1]|uniref:bifunctional hydroxymethylpyrimidine kinase/phosphomethylpyrimidine kinase n=1 Tax=Thioalkalivibrio sp. HK1 TaxID=1469245 RepID=UPI00046FB3B0|nr:hydroxymethylpyrimidine/phosphomethylpyrimidine kinase [Thioalkalivibrio sp. HK1]